MTWRPALLLWWLAAACGAQETGEVAVDSTVPIETAAADSETEPPVDTTVPARWTGEAEVEVRSADGAPVVGAWVMVGGTPPETWAQTGADGRAVVTVGDDGLTDRYLTAGAEGWRSGGVDLDDEDGPTGTLAIVMLPAPPADNLDYPFQAGGDEESPDTTECGHCHRTIAGDWSRSRHRGAGRNPHTWDLFVGSATLAPDCDALGGWQAEGQVPGVEGAVSTRCSVATGVLPFLHDDCGALGQPACDHPDQRPQLERFGSCGDCHTPAIDGATPGAVDLAGATGIAFDEGVTCDLCHKIAAVEPGGAPGLDGGFTLRRPTEPSTVATQVWEPIYYGPYPDVITPIMKGSYAPQFLEAEWCSSCHEYTQPALHPDQSVDAERWPDGLPILETWSEFEAADLGADGLRCQACHMPALDEDSSTYDLGSIEELSYSVDQGWYRAPGEVRHHEFGAALTPPALELDVVQAGDRVLASARVHNAFAGHAVPTGEPMRQLVLLVQATDDAGAPLTLLEGGAVPDVGGALATGVVGGSVSVDGDALLFDAPVPVGGVAVRFARPDGSFVDYPGPGTAAFSSSEPSAEDKGLARMVPLGERAVSGIDGARVSLVAAPPDLQPGDVAYLVADGHLAGSPGWLFGKVLVDAQGARGVAHYRAVDVASDDRIPPGATRALDFSYALPAAGQAHVTARLLRRRYGSPVAGEHGWDTEDEELRLATGTAGEAE